MKHCDIEDCRKIAMGRITISYGVFGKRVGYYCSTHCCEIGQSFGFYYGTE